MSTRRANQGPRSRPSDSDYRLSRTVDSSPERPLVGTSKLTDTGGSAKRFEQRLLLHPSLDQPDKHLEFIDEGFVRPALNPSGKPSPKGKASIEVYGLNRKGLVEERRNYLIRVRGLMWLIEQQTLVIQNSPGTLQAREVLTGLIAELEHYSKDDQAYAGMVRQFIKRFKKTVIS